MTMHARFSASASDRWLNCPGSLALSQGHSGAASYASAEGTMLHALGERCLFEEGDPYDYVGQEFVVDGFTFELDDEQAGAVTQYVEYIRGFSGIKMYEVRSDYASALNLPAGEAFGTADCVIWQEDEQHLHIVDAKFGRKFVNARENRQLILYAIGVATTLRAVGDDPVEVTLHIVQPRVSATPIPYTLSGEELEFYAADFAKSAVKAQKAIETYQVGRELELLPYLVAGESQCQWCPAKANCPALRKEVDESMKNVPDVIGFMPAAQLSKEQSKLTLIRMYCDAVETETLRRLLAGEPVDGYKMVLGREGNRKWVSEDKIVDLLNKLQSTYKLPEDDLWSPKKPKTLPQIEKVLKKAKVPVNLEPYQVRSPAKPTMASADDPRATWVPNAAVDEEFDAV
jgi:hypothetical protein